MQRSLARRERRHNHGPVDRRGALGGQMTAAWRGPLTREPLAKVRDLADSEIWELSLGRSRARRRAANLRFVPARTRARRISLGTLVAFVAAPTASLGDANGISWASAKAATPATTTTRKTSGTGLSDTGEPTPSLAEAADRSAPTSSAARENPVKVLQQTLHVGVDGIFGPATLAAVERFQREHHLVVDGIVGPQTWAALGYEGMKEVSEAYAWVVATERMQHPEAAKATSTVAAGNDAGSTRSSMSDEANIGDPVRLLQSLLHVVVDGEFGPETLAAVESFQSEHGLEADGVVGPETWGALGFKDVKEIFPLLSAWPKKAAASSSTSGGGVQASSGGAESGDGASTPVPPAAREAGPASTPTSPSTPTGSTFAICVANHEAGEQGSTSPATVNWTMQDPPYEGGFQWLTSTWLAQGGGRYAPRAVEATPAQQIAIFEAAEASDPGAWPVSVPACGG